MIEEHSIFPGVVPQAGQCIQVNRDFHLAETLFLKLGWREDCSRRSFSYESGIRAYFFSGQDLVELAQIVEGMPAESSEPPVVVCANEAELVTNLLVRWLEYSHIQYTVTEREEKKKYEVSLPGFFSRNLMIASVEV